MRTHIWPLMKVLLRTSLRSSFQRMTGTNSRWGYLLLPLFALGMIPLLIMFAVGWGALYFRLDTMDQGHLTLTLALTAGQLVCLAFGILYVISVFYFSRDLKILVPLPLRPGEIVLTKFLGILIGEYLTMAPVVLPALAVYGAFANPGPLYIPFALLIYLLLPVAPLVLSALFTIVLMRVTNLRRHRDLFRFFGALVGIGVAFAIQLFGRMQRGLNSVEAIDALLEGQEPLIDAISSYVVTSVWATNALRAGAPGLGIPSLLLFVGFVGLALYLVVQVGEWMFFGGLLGSEETYSSGRQLSREELANETRRVRSPLVALFLREVRLLNRTSSFLMAGLLPPLIMPVFMLLPMLGPGGPFEHGTDLSRFAGHPWVPVLFLGAMLFLNTISAVPSSAISREGRWFWVSQSIPVPTPVLIQAKLLHSLLFALLNLAVVIGVMFWLRLVTPFHLAVVLVGGLLVSVVTGYSGLLIDVIRPNLTWTDPQQAMKGNINGLFALLANLVLGVVTGGGAALLYAFARPVFLPGLLGILALEGWALGRATGALAERRFVEYER
ncbi:MAG: putative ABC transporter permease subunit [Bacillota bacterium]